MLRFLVIASSRSLSRSMPCLASLLVLCAIVAGCGSVRMRDAVPKASKDDAIVAGYSRAIRTWGTRVSPEFAQQCYGGIMTQHRAYYAAHPEIPMPRTADILCISGGGEDGAFGAGLLSGWSNKGDRPPFVIVTGVSTGALSAPMAFLGPPYDQKLSDAYIRSSQKDIFLVRPILFLFRADSVADTKPLAELLERYVDDAMLREVAKEWHKGRRLLVGTTNLDAQEPVIWDLGAIAASGRPDSLKLFRDVMRASAAIPGFFEPVYIKVQVGDKTYEEMHVDGGVIAEAFLLGMGVDLGRLRGIAGVQSQYPTRVFVIRNGKVAPEFSTTRAVLPDIASRAISTLIKGQGLSDLLRLYLVCQANQFDYNVAVIPESFTDKLAEPFETRYMNNLYKLGYDMGRAGYPWQKAPPSMLVTPVPTAPPASPVH